MIIILVIILIYTLEENNISVQIKPASTIVLHLGLEPYGRIQKFFANECYKAMDQYVPMDEGDLRSNVSMSVDGTQIIYESPYARYQYYGVRQDGTRPVRNYTTPGTGPYWDKRMWSVKKDKILRSVQREIKRGG